MYLKSEKTIYNDIKRMIDNRMSNNTIMQKNDDQIKRTFGTNKVAKKDNVDVIETVDVFLVYHFRIKREKN